MFAFADDAGHSLYTFKSAYHPTPSTLIHVPAQAKYIILKSQLGAKPGSAPLEMAIYRLDRDNVLRVAKEAAQTAPTVSFAGRTMTINCFSHSGEQAHLILPLLYSRHYKSTVNGAETPVSNAMGLVAIPLPHDGNHVVSLTFELPGQTASFILSAVAPVLLLVLYCFIRRRHAKRTEVILLRILTVMFLAWLLLPAGSAIAYYIYKLIKAAIGIF